MFRTKITDNPLPWCWIYRFPEVWLKEVRIRSLAVSPACLILLKS
jgi:hypothetical protein